MPDDLIDHVVGPTPYSSWWFWLALLLSVIVIAWYAGVLLVTMPDQRIRRLPLVGVARDRMIRHRCARAVHTIGARYLAGELAASSAAAAISGELRRFLRQATGVRAEYMQLHDIADSEISSTTGVFAGLIDVQFNPESELDVSRLGRDAEELIRSWD